MLDCPPILFNSRCFPILSIHAETPIEVLPPPTGTVDMMGMRTVFFFVFVHVSSQNKQKKYAPTNMVLELSMNCSSA